MVILVMEDIMIIILLIILITIALTLNKILVEIKFLRIEMEKLNNRKDMENKF